MKTILAVLVIGWYAFCIGIGMLSAGLTVYGIYLAFCASLILGVATLCIPPAALIFGVVQFFLHTNLPVMVVQWLQSHSG